jgi:hypothetical protein
LSFRQTRGRNTQGIRFAHLEDGDKVDAVACVVKDENDNAKIWEKLLKNKEIAA